LLATAICSIVLAASIASYLLLADRAVATALNIALLSIVLVAWLTNRDTLLYRTWSILLSSIVYCGLQLTAIVPGEISLLTSLLVLTALLTPLGKHVETSMWSHTVAAVLVVGLVGIALNLRPISWIVLSPLVELALLDKSRGLRLSTLYSTYTICLYALVMRFSLAMTAYMLAACILKLQLPLLSRLDTIWADSTIRAALAVVRPWM